MNRCCLVYQPCGLGDILFLQKFAHYQINKGYEIWWPVVSEFEWLNNYIPNINFVSWGDTDRKLTGPPLPDHVNFPYKDQYLPQKQNYFSNEFIFFNGFSHIPHGRKIMAFKYEMVGLDYSDWSKYLIFNRNIDKEKQLFYDVLKLSDNEPYVFINKKFMMRPYVSTMDRISSDPNHYKKRVVELDILKGFSMFDWSMVLEKASEIHMIETALNYIIESSQLTLTANTMNLYSRINNFSEVDYLFKTKWNYKYF
jgi:hypothetical protein